eukprot:4556429-Amphidinium_carterae.1
MRSPRREPCGAQGGVRITQVGICNNHSGLLAYAQESLAIVIQFTHHLWPNTPRRSTCKTSIEVTKEQGSMWTAFPQERIKVSPPAILRFLGSMIARSMCIDHPERPVFQGKRQAHKPAILYNNPTQGVEPQSAESNLIPSLAVLITRTMESQEV